MPRVVLHIGAPKSGTTYLQARLAHNAAALAEHGVLVPRADVGEPEFAFLAACDLTGVRMGRSPEAVEGRWDQLVEAVRSHEGTVVVSHEAFVRCDDEQAAQAVAALGPDVGVIYTARDLGRAVVSGWLEGLKHGTDLDFADYLDAAREGSLPVLRAFDLPAVLGRWAAHAPVRLVTVAPSGAAPDLLWDRFAHAAAIEPGWAPEPGRRGNESVGLPEAQVLRLLNGRLGAGKRRGGGLHAVIRDVVVPPLAGGRSPRVELDPAHHGWVAERAAAYVAWVHASPVEVVGDLADLTPPAPTPAWRDPDVVTPEAAEAASRVMAKLVREVRRLRREVGSD